MKDRVKYLFLAVTLFISACAKSDGGSTPIAGRCAGNPALGSWSQSSGYDPLIIRDDCTGTTGNCAAEFEYQDIGNDQAIIDITSVKTQSACTLSPGQRLTVQILLFNNESPRRLFILWPNGGRGNGVNYFPN